MKRIVIATKNAGKLREMKEAFAHLPVEVCALSDFGELPDAVENGATFADNARIKAHFYAEQTGCACLADDSGIEIAVLDDAANNEKMIAEIKKAGCETSPADYRCALVFADTDGCEIETQGRCDGEIRFEARGMNGFGYDPYFYVGDRTMAEMTLEEKDAISHRGQALRKMVFILEAYLK